MSNQPESTLHNIKKELFKQSVGSAIVAYPAAVTTLGAVAGGLFGFSAVITGIVALGALVSVGGFTTLFAVRREENIKRIMSQITSDMEKRRETIVNELKKEISQLELKKAATQLESFKSHFATFVDVLDDRFNPSELTFLRYMNVAEQVYLSGMDNLRDAVISYKATHATDIKELRSRLTDKDLHQEEKAAIQKRVESYESALKKIDELLVLNEKAIATLDQVTHKLAVTQVDQAMAESDTDSAIGELERLGNMLAQYSRK